MTVVDMKMIVQDPTLRQRANLIDLQIIIKNSLNNVGTTNLITATRNPNVKFAVEYGESHVYFSIHNITIAPMKGNIIATVTVHKIENIK